MFLLFNIAKIANFQVVHILKLLKNFVKPPSLEFLFIRLWDKPTKFRIFEKDLL